MAVTHRGFFDNPLAEIDPAMGDIVARELARQQTHIELIASENLASCAVMQAQGSVITNKTVEGYPGKRYHGGAAVVDEMERLGIARARELFDCAYANLQPHSGSQANQTVLHALLGPGPYGVGLLHFGPWRPRLRDFRRQFWRFTPLADLAVRVLIG